MDKILEVAQIITGLTAIVAIVLSILQNRNSMRISKTDFLLTLKDAFLQNNRYEIHVQLREGKKIENWANLDDYLGLFEVCEIMIQENTLSENVFKKLYSYRLKNILGDDEVVFYKFIMESEDWTNLIKLYIRIFPNAKNVINEYISFADIVEQELKKVVYNDLHKEMMHLSGQTRNKLLEKIKEIRKIINMEGNNRIEA